MERLTRLLWIPVNLPYTLCNDIDETSVLWILGSLFYDLWNFWRVENGFE